MVRRWRRVQGVLFNGELKMSARWKTIDGPLHPKISWARSTVVQVVYRAKKSRWEFICHVYVFFGWNQNEMNLSRNFLTASIVCIVSHFNSLVGTNTSDWLQSCGVKTMLSKQSLHSARSIFIYFPQWIKCYCLCRFRYCRERINVTSESEGTIKTGSGTIP